MFTFFVVGVSILVAIVAITAILASLQPPEMRVTRSTLISAPPQSLFEQINDFHRWQAWSPYAKLDPAVKNTYDGPSAGKDAGFAWSGNNKVGEGRMTIMDSNPNELIRIKLEFTRPFKGNNTTEFTFKPVQGQTNVTWLMYGQKNFMSKAFGLFVNMDRMIGTDFEKGLANLRALAEGV